MTAEGETLAVIRDLVVYGSFFLAWVMGYRQGRAGV